MPWLTVEAIVMCSQEKNIGLYPRCIAAVPQRRRLALLGIVTAIFVGLWGVFSHVPSSQPSPTGQVAVPGEGFGADRVIGVDLDGDGREELLGVRLPRAWVLKEKSGGWAPIWSGIITPPDELQHWENKGEVALLQAGRFADNRDAVALVMVDAAAKLSSRLLFLQWDPDEQRLIIRLSQELPDELQGPNHRFDNSLVLHTTENGVFLTGIVQPEAPSPFQLIRWELKHNSFTEVKRVDIQYADATYARDIQLGWLDGRRVLAVNTGMVGADVYGWSRIACYDLASLLLISTADEKQGLLVAGNEHQNSLLLSTWPELALYAWQGNQWLLQQQLDKDTTSHDLRSTTVYQAREGPVILVWEQNRLDVLTVKGEILTSVEPDQNLNSDWRPYVTGVGSLVIVASRSGTSIYDPQSPGGRAKMVWQG